MLYDIMSDPLFWKLGGAFVCLIVVIHKQNVKTFEQEVKLLKSSLKENIHIDLQALKKDVEGRIKDTIDEKFDNFKRDFQLNINDTIDKAIERQKKHGQDNLENIKNMAIQIIDSRAEKAEKLLEQIIEKEKEVLKKYEK